MRGVPRLHAEVDRLSTRAAYAAKELLEVYFKEGFIRVFNRSFIVKPYVQCSNVDSLADALLGYRKVVISHAALRGGASNISFNQ